MTEPIFAWGVAETAAAVRSGAVSAEAVTMSALDRIAAIDGALNAFRVVLPERALAEARAVDALIARGVDPGPLAGVPFGVKDLFDVSGLPTAAGSKIGVEGSAAREDAVLVRRSKAAGAVLLGVQVMDEYAYGFTTQNAHYGAVHNPNDLTRTAGGSSGGSAAAVAAGLGAFSLGSDTNGSIRAPSSFCGVFGLKPTFGRLPRTGSFPFVFDLDHLGPFARSVGDLALVYDVLQGFDGGDAACVERAVEPVSRQGEGAPLRCAVLAGWFQDMAGSEASAAVSAVAEALAAKDSATLAGAEAVRSAAFLITAASAANLHRANLEARPNDFDPATRYRLLAGALLPAGEVIQAQRIRRVVHAEALELFSRFDVLIAPATPCPAPRLDQSTIVIGGREAPLRPNLGLLAQPISAIGLPVVTAPIRLGEGLPVGVQLIAPPWREDLAFRAADQLERAGLAAARVVTP